MRFRQEADSCALTSKSPVNRLFRLFAVFGPADPPSERFVPGHHGPGYPGEFVSERNGGDLGGTPRQQRGEPWPMPSAVDFGITDYGECASRKQARRLAC
jgi:hypothetical protein